MSACANTSYLAEHERKIMRAESSSESLAVRTEEELKCLRKALYKNFKAARRFLQELERENEIDIDTEAAKMDLFDYKRRYDYLDVIALMIADDPSAAPCVVKHARKLAKEALQNV